MTVLSSTAPDSTVSTKVAQSLSQLTVTILYKKPELTSIAISHINSTHWFVGGQSLQQDYKASFFFAIRITDETNTAHEKADYINVVFNAMNPLLGDLHHESFTSTCMMRVRRRMVMAA